MAEAVARGVGTWDEVISLPLYHVQLILEEAEKNQAAYFAQMLDVTHAANAPLLAGSDGTTVFDKMASRLRKIVNPNSGGTVFQRLMKRAGL